ncbi:MAG: glycosyltransferase family 39 protein [Candidatus Sumerlaeota bacterium]|nr:glycosyltransferase family 39 protein [Candidatus Sumerlaeota bacterium]
MNQSLLDIPPTRKTEYFIYLASPPRPSVCYGFLAAFLILLLAPGAFLRDMWIFDEGRRALVALEMLKRGRWAVPTLMGESFLTKPPLFYWSEALSFRLFGGPSDWAARLPSVVAGVVGALAFAILLRRLLGSMGAALFGAVALAVSPVYLFMSQQAESEMMYVAFSVAAATCFFEGSLGERRRIPWLLAFWAFAGLSLMAKAPLAPGALLISIVLWAALTRNRSPIPKSTWIAGPLVLLAPAALWGLAIVHAGYSPWMIWTDAKTHLSPEAAHAKSFGHYLGTLREVLFPWFYALCVALIVALGRLARGGREGLRGIPRRLRAWLLGDRGAGLFLALWAAGGFLAFSCLPAKRYYYMLAVAPPLCGLLAMAYRDLFEGQRLTARRVTGKRVKMGSMESRLQAESSMACLDSIRGIPPEGGTPYSPFSKEDARTSAGVRKGLAWLVLAGAVALLIGGSLAPSPWEWESYSGRGNLDGKALLLWGGMVALGLAAVLRLLPSTIRNVSPWRASLVWVLVCTTGLAFAYVFWVHRRINERQSLRIAAEEIRRAAPVAPSFSLGSNHTIWFYLGNPDVAVLDTAKQLQEYLARHPSAVGVASGESAKIMAQAGVEVLYKSDFILRPESQIYLIRARSSAGR